MQKRTRCHDCGSRRVCYPHAIDGEEICRVCASMRNRKRELEEREIDARVRHGATPYEAAKELGLNED